jgi:fumarate reductase flavoprotein subunit
MGGGAIAVNKDGRRYGNEAGYYPVFSAATMEQAEVFCILDATLMESDRVRGDIGLSSIREMYTKADTVEELANKLGINAANLKETIATYGEYVRKGADEQFGKPSTALTSELSTSPYYGVKSKVENHLVFGGLNIDNGAHVLRDDGSIVEGLYAVGETALFKEAGRSPLSYSIDTGRLAVASISGTA